MPSSARVEFAKRLADVDELILAHTAITGGGKGRPEKRQGAAITRAGIVMLAAAMEAFVEELYEEAAVLVFPRMSQARKSALFRVTSERMHNVGVDNINHLFLNIGIGWVLDSIRWQKFTNASVLEAIKALVAARNQVAHGATNTFRLNNLKSWKNTCERLAEKLEAKAADRIEQATGARPAW